MNRSIFNAAFPAILSLFLTGCLIETETAITPDPKADPRLEGVWKRTEKLPGEVRGDRDGDDIGVNGYLMVAALAGEDGTAYKALAFDSFERDTPSTFPEMIVSTRKHKGHNYMLVSLTEDEKKKADAGDGTLKNWVVDYEFDERGDLFLRFLLMDDLDEILKAHPMESKRLDGSFAPATLRGDEKELLDFYSDPKVRALLVSMGKYERLKAREK
jgi:hypothetical protein